MWNKLLGHLMSPKEIASLGIAARHARVYQYSLEDHFKDMSEADASVKAMEDCRGMLQVRPETPITQSSAIIINFLKCRLVRSGVFSLPKHLFDLALDSTSSKYVPVHLSALELIHCMQAGAPHADMCRNLVVFQIVDAFAERKYQITQLHTEQRKTDINVSVFRVFSSHPGGCSVDGQGEPLTLDVSQWCGVNFSKVMQTMCGWVVQPGGISVEVSLNSSLLDGVVPALPLQPPMALADEACSVLAVSSGSVSHPQFNSGYMELATFAPDPGATSIVQHSRIPQLAVPLIQSLVSRKAFAENNTFLELAALDDRPTVDTIDLLRRLGVVQLCQRGGSGPLQIALCLGSIKLGATLHLSNPTLVARLPFRPISLNKHSKLELVQYLFGRNFKPVTDVPEMLVRKSKSPQMWAEGLYASKNYLLALCYSQIICFKPGSLPGIMHQGTHAYYKCLLELPDLHAISGKTIIELKDTSEKQFIAILKDLTNRDAMHHPADGVPTVADGPEEDMLAIEDAPHEAPIPSIAQAAIEITPAIMAENAVPSRVPGFRPMRVCFDNWTHSSGNRRVFIHCSLHDSCRLYVFLKDFPSQDRAIAYLLAWNHNATRWPDRTACKLHIAGKPQSEEVDFVQNEQFN